jgi:hypothetical protein
VLRSRLRATRAVVGGIAVLAAGAGAAFALTRDEKACTLIGSSNEVTVRLIAADRRELKRATVCVDGRCTRWLRGTSDVFVPVKATGPRVVPVLLVLERAGEPADVRAMNTRLERFEPNGSGCGTWWRANVTSDGASPVPKRKAG